MQLRKHFINKHCEDFLEVGSYDYDELKLEAQNLSHNIAIEMDALNCLQFFPEVRHLILRPGTVQQDGLKFLHGLPILSLKLDYYCNSRTSDCIDLAWFPCLQYVFSRSQFNFHNINCCNSLCTLVVQEWYDEDLRYLNSRSLQALSIFGGALKSLCGIKNLPNLMSLSLSNMRRLLDISELECCSQMESLSIERCNQLHVSNIPALTNLRFLQLFTRNNVDNFSFITMFPNLSYLITDVKSIDGDLTPLLGLRHCAIMTDCRHYSAKNRDLPKAPCRFMSNVIPRWLEILPEN